MRSGLWTLGEGVLKTIEIESSALPWSSHTDSKRSLGSHDNFVQHPTMKRVRLKRRDYILYLKEDGR